MHVPSRSARAIALNIVSFITVVYDVKICMLIVYTEQNRYINGMFRIKTILAGLLM